MPEEQFRLYAVCSRYPHNLAGQVPWEQLRAGVYQCRRGADVIRMVVAGQLPQMEHNALLHLFSAAAPQIAYGAQHYRQRSAETSTLLQQLFQRYEGEELSMAYTMEDFQRDFLKNFLKDLTPEKRQLALRSLLTEEVLKSLPTEEVLKSLPLEEIEHYLQRRREASASSPEKRKGSRRGRKDQQR